MSVFAHFFVQNPSSKSKLAIKANDILQSQFTLVHVTLAIKVDLTQRSKIEVIRIKAKNLGFRKSAHGKIRVLP